MRTIISLLVLTVFVRNAAALQCHLCIGSSTSDCAKGDISAMVPQTCEDSLPASINPLLARSNFQQRDDVPTVTTCVALAFQNQGATVAERGCGFIWQDVDICEYVSTLVDVEACSNCDEDFCNIKPIPVSYNEPKVELLT